MGKASDGRFERQKGGGRSLPWMLILFAAQRHTLDLTVDNFDKVANIVPAVRMFFNQWYRLTDEANVLESDESVLADGKW